MTGPQGEVRIERLCALAQVSRASFYRSWSQSEPDREEMALRDAIQRLALAHRHYGYRRIAALLRREGWTANAKRVLRIMRDDNLLCLRKKAYAPATTDSNHGWRVYPNLARRMVPMAPDRLWVADITYIRLERAFVYLAVVLDAFSRKVVGWALADHLAASLALEALRMALANRRPPPGELVHHSDRGVQYACADYTQALEDATVIPSMSRGGCPYDNAKAESFMKTLKTEEVDGSAYRDLPDARACVGAFIEQVYNTTRLHSRWTIYHPWSSKKPGCGRRSRRPQPLQQPLSPNYAVSPRGCSPSLLLHFLNNESGQEQLLFEKVSKIFLFASTWASSVLVIERLSRRRRDALQRAGPERASQAGDAACLGQQTKRFHVSVQGRAGQTPARHSARKTRGLSIVRQGLAGGC